MVVYDTLKAIQGGAETTKGAFGMKKRKEKKSKNDI